MSQNVMSQNNDKNNDKRLANLIPMKPGETRNPNGRPKGQRNYATIYREALAKIAKAENMTADELETMLEETGIKQSLKGNFAFWKDIRDRIHGKAVERTQVEVTLPKPILGGLAHGLYGNHSNQEDSETREED